MSRHPASIAKAALLLALSLSQALAQQPEPKISEPRSEPPVNSLKVSGDERKELKRRLDESAPVAINVNNPDGVPLQIKEAQVKGVRRDEQHWTKSGEAVLSDYVMSARLTFENTTDNNARLIYLRFTEAEKKSVFFVSYLLERQKNPQASIQFMVVTGDPSRYVVEVFVARLQDGRVWTGRERIVPPGPTEASKAQTEEAKPQAAQRSVVDTKPQLLNRLTPSYTEEARENKVQGTVRLRLLVGADGAVKQVRVTNALPDGLTEEAIRLAYKMKWKPAMKDGAAVAFWLPVVLEFNIRV